MMPPKVRLVGGTRINESRVEVLYKGAYGTVCDDSWDDRDAASVCRMLGLSGGTAFQGNSHRYGSGTGVILLDSIRCIGNKTSLFDFPHIGNGITFCSHSEDAGVSCYWP